MNKSSLMPGQLSVSSSFIIVNTQTGKIIARTQPLGVETLDVSYEEACANANLLAYAPDLLAECKELRDLLRQESISPMLDLKEIAKIKKAETIIKSAEAEDEF